MHSASISKCIGVPSAGVLLLLSSLSRVAVITRSCSGIFLIAESRIYNEAFGDGDGSSFVGLTFSSYSSISESYLLMITCYLVTEFLVSFDDVSFNEPVT